MRLGRPHAIAGLAIVLALLFLAYRFNLPMPSGGQGDSSGQPAVVGVQTARFEALRDALQVPGTVVPTTAGDWTIVAPEAAKIVELPKAQGDSVEAGDLLVRFEVAAISDEITARENEVNEAAARAATAKAEAERLGSLHERGLTPRNTYEAARAALGSAESALAQARGRLESARVIQQVTIIKARFPGVVANRWHNVGDFVTGGPADPVLRVIDPKRVQVAVQLSAAQLARVTPGQYATVQLPGADAVPASVGTKPAPPESGSAATVEVRVTPATPLTLPLETQVQVTIVLDERPKAVVVPSDAIVRDDQTTYVMIAGDDNRAHRRQVHTGLVTGGLTEIISGVTVGERVIVIGLNNVTDGAAIKTGTG